MGGITRFNCKFIVFILFNIGLVKVIFCVVKVYTTVLSNCLLFKRGAVFALACYFFRLPYYIFWVMAKLEVFHLVRGLFIILLAFFVLKVYFFIIFVYKRGARIVSYLFIRVIVIVIVVVNNNG